MWDLVAGAIVLVALASGLFYCGRRSARHGSVWLSSSLAAFAVTFIFAFGMIAQGKLLVASLLPFSNAIVLGNGIALATALLAGIKEK